MKIRKWTKRQTPPLVRANMMLDPMTCSFRQLEKKAASCRLCPRLADQPAVLSSSNGSLDSQIIFVAEAPGRFGAGRTGVPFQGDRSGDNFETLINHIKLNRSEIFITNAVLCNPLENGNNRKPNAGEIKNCSTFLEETLGVIQPKVVVTLGTVALQSMNKILGTRFQLNTSVAKPLPAPEFTLFPLYHPSPRVTNWKRTMDQQKKDFKNILRLLKA
jgi:uracil-DNA glycosylase